MNRMGTAVGEEGQTGRRPFRWEKAKPCVEKALRSRELSDESPMIVKGERELKRWRRPFEWAYGGRA